MKRKSEIEHQQQQEPASYELRGNSFNVKPQGNLLLLSGKQGDKSRRALGRCFNRMSESRILELLALLGPHVTTRLMATCAFLYVLGMQEELWRNWVIEERLTLLNEKVKKPFKFVVNWKTTWKASRQLSSWTEDIPIHIKDGIYSDYLYHSFKCLNVPLNKLTNAARTKNIDRRSNLSMDDFLRDYAVPGKPVIITDVIKGWPAFKKWDFDFFLKGNSTGEEERFRAESLDLTFDEYYNYMRQANEESPLYLFDKLALERDQGSLSSDFTVPAYFSQDLFSVLGSRRPDYRWLIMGPARSGSTFHIDPNATSAWNAVIKGRKKWILTPPNTPPPGVYPSHDGGEVTSPVSLVEWYLNHYHELEDMPNVVEAVVEEGEILYIPSKWWHSVLNLDDGIALTQNFVSDFNLKTVLSFLKKRPDQVSGYCVGESETCNGDLFDDFLEGLKKEKPEVLKDLDERLVTKRSSGGKKPLTRWEALTATTKGEEDVVGLGESDEATCSTLGHTSGSGSFSFNFCEEEESEG